MTPLDALCPAPFHTLPDADRARVLNRLADTELFVALAEEPRGDRVRLHLFAFDGSQTGIAADSEDRLASFFGGPVAYAALPGRVLAAMLSAEGVALTVNPRQRSEMMLDPATLGWLAEALSSAPQEERAASAYLAAPSPEMVAALAEPLATRLADMTGLAESAALVSARWPDGAQGHLIVVTGAPPPRHKVIAKALAEMIAFLPPLPDACDVAFDLKLPPNAPVIRAERNAPAAPPALRAPGSDPDKPPILRF
ncbi:hypothetical protein SAMN05421538_104163 [Paracoccus isoporae]|uniref:SseB protein N-terminal domain-containing protein n=1 Tax=Paracoccus isoporae TaxID=591205 RepID=A0A1G7AJ97_9RHOB|nr:SseB family protein [Paracoccus isoporae]SDE15004.1 hypothetical protein SAMN05421538_104163 [Paracoccus isoporae]